MSVNPTKCNARMNHDLTLGQNVHRVIHLNVHVVANLGQFLPLGRHDLAILTLELVRRSTILGKTTRDDDAVTIGIMLIRLFALVLQGKGHFGDTVVRSIRSVV